MPAQKPASMLPMPHAHRKMSRATRLAMTGGSQKATCAGSAPVIRARIRSSSDMGCPAPNSNPVVGVVRGEEHFITKAVFHILPRRPLLKAQQEGHGVGRYAEQKAEEPARYGAEGDVS